jgi:hypothetical protein
MKQSSFVPLLDSRRFEMTQYFIASIVTFWALLAISFFPNDAQAGKNHPQQRAGWISVNRFPQVIVLPPLKHRSVRAPGWNRGRKTGWGACNVPPGQAKKLGCTSTIFPGRRNDSPRRPVILIPLP